MKHLIKIESTAHGVLGVRHEGKDQQYCEAGETVILEWQPDAKWGLQEAHYTDSDGNITPIGLTPVKVDGKDEVVFTMPNANITIGGTFKMFVSQDWTEGTNPSKGEVLTVGNNGEPTPISVDELANEIAEGDNNLVDSIDAINPFKGWYANLATLQASHPSPQIGDYAYVKGAEATDPAAIYECTTAGSWSDSGRTADTSNVQTFASSQEVNEVHIVNDLTTGGINDVLSAEQGKFIADTTMELVESNNILNESMIILDRRIKQDGTQATNNSSTADLIYGCTDYIELVEEGLILNHGIVTTATSAYGAIIYNASKEKIGRMSATTATGGNGGYVRASLTSYVQDPAEGVTDLVPKYIRFNLYKPTIPYDGINDGYAIYKGMTLPTPTFQPWFEPYLTSKIQEFESGEKINEVQIDNTNLADPNENSIAKAVDVKNSIDGINAKISDIDYSETNVELVTSGEGQNVYSGLVAAGYWIDSNNGPYLLIPVDGVKKIKFLAGEKSTNTSEVGFAIGTFSGEPNATLEGFSDVYHSKYALSSTTRQVEYEVVIPQGYTGLYAAISIWKSAGVTTDNFYCKTISGDTLDDVIQEKIDNSETSVKPSTSTSSVGNINIHCAKEHTFNDGTPPILEWFLVEEPMGKFYYTTDFNAKTLLFTFANSMYYQFGILENGDIIAVRLADSLDDSTPQSDSKRTNPYVWKAEENWSVQHEVMFGDYDATNASDASDIANITGLKPCGWLSNKGFRVLPDGSAMFGEYTRPTVETCNVWRITGDALDPENWYVVKTFYPIGGDGFAGYKHVHHIGVDHYTGTVYCATGDVDSYAQIWYTLDYGGTWTQISKKSALNNGQQFRLCFMTFTKDYILWATDTPGISTGNPKHVVYRGERDENGILDSSTLEMICNVYDGVGNISSYGQAYLQEYDALFLFDRQDGGGTQSEYIPLFVVDIKTGNKYKVAELTSTKSTTSTIGFRTKFKEWYPINGVIRVGFGYDTTYCNWNKVCGNGEFSIGATTRGKTSVNNLCLIVKKDGDNWTCRFSTYYV